MRIKSTDDRERLWEDLREATAEGHTSQALDTAARHYVRCRGNTTAVPTGTYAELLAAARDADSGLGPEQIADILDTDELPVAASTTTEISIGDS
jgi:hypothetical protein